MLSIERKDNPSLPIELPFLGNFVRRTRWQGERLIPSKRLKGHIKLVRISA